MLFFRSEEAIATWCRDNGQEQGPLVTIPQLWQLAVRWYRSRLDPDARRPKPAEMVRIFGDIGLRGEFWNPAADRFGS